jgi:hypothetical protein
MRCEIVPATAQALQHVIDNVRPEDAAEFWAFSRQTAAEVVGRGAAASALLYVGLVDGEPVCCFGVVPASLLTGIGCPWMVATPGVERVARRFALASAPVVEEMQALFPQLLNFVDNRNVKAMRWLEWLGFQLLPAMPMGPDALPFRPFIRRRADHV